MYFNLPEKPCDDGSTKVASGEEKWKKVCVKMKRAISENNRKRVLSFDCEIIVTIKVLVWYMSC